MSCTSEDGRVERAERLSRQRTNVLVLECALFIAGQLIFVLMRSPDAATLNFGTREFHLWNLVLPAWTLLLLLLIATGGGLRLSRDLRRVLNDEMSTAHRFEGQRWGFWAAMCAAMLLYFASLVTPIALRLSLHAILTSGIGAALGRYAWLERRAERAG